MDEETGDHEHDAQDQVDPSPTADGQLVNVVRGHHGETALMTTTRPWKNWETPTMARMTPAKTVSPLWINGSLNHGPT